MAPRESILLVPAFDFGSRLVSATSCLSPSFFHLNQPPPPPPYLPRMYVCTHMYCINLYTYICLSGRKRRAGDPGLRVVGAPDDPFAVRDVREALRRPGHVHPQEEAPGSAGHLLRERRQQLPGEPARHPGERYACLDGGYIWRSVGHTYVTVGVCCRCSALAACARALSWGLWVGLPRGKRKILYFWR